MTSKILITNGDLGTDANRFVHFNLSSWQGRRALERAIAEHTKNTGKNSWAELWRGNGYSPASVKL
jgi:hypothetical protein